MKKLFIIILILLSTISVKAYENDILKIDIDESYKLETETKNTIRWTKENKYIAISISDNKKLKYDVKTFSQTDIDNQKEYFENGINKGLEKYNIKAEISSITKNNINDIYYLEYDIYYPSKNATGYNMYQKGRMYTTNKYIVTIIYSSDTSLDKDDLCKKTLDSLLILDNYNVNKNSQKGFVYAFIAIGVIAGIVGAVISIKKRHK